MVAESKDKCAIDIVVVAGGYGNVGQTVEIVGKLVHGAGWTGHPRLFGANGRSLEKQGQLFLSIAVFLGSKVHHVGNVNDSQQEGNNGHGPQGGKVQSGAESKVSHLGNGRKEGRIEFGGSVHFTGIGPFQRFVALGKETSVTTGPNGFVHPFGFFLVFVRVNVPRKRHVLKVCPRLGQ